MSRIIFGLFFLGLASPTFAEGDNLAPVEALKVPASLPTVEKKGEAAPKSDSKEFDVKIGGLLHLDSAWHHQASALTFPGGIGTFQDGVTPRRARLRAEGKLASDIDFLMEIEFAAAVGPAPGTTPTNSNTTFSPAPINAWVTIHELPLVENLRIGQQKEPISLEHLTTAKNLEFLERSYQFDANQASAFNNARSPGLSVFRTWLEDRVYTAIGVFKNISDPYAFGLGQGQYAVTGRVGFLPLYLPEEKRSWYFGGAMSHRDSVNGQVVVRVRNSVRGEPAPLLNSVATTGTLFADSQDLFNLETAAVHGPWTIQAEYLANLINGTRLAPSFPSLGTVVFHGYYVEALYFLTGESRAWDPKNAGYARAGITPLRPFHSKSGCREGYGAWELAARYQYLSLNDKLVRAGQLHDVTLGLNWYWNQHAKMQFNYDWMQRDKAANDLARGVVHSLGIRLAYDF